MSTDAKLEAYIVSCPYDERLRLAAWRSSSNGKIVQCGAIVKTCTANLFEDELMLGIINKPYIYSIITYEEEYNEPSTLSAWTVNWATEHLPIPDNLVSFSLVYVMDETKMEVIMNPGDDLPTNTTYAFADYFEKNDRGDWTIKKCVLRCEFCGLMDCGQIQQKDDLDNGIRDLMMEEDLRNKQKRYQMYRDWIRFKYGSLGPSEKKHVDKYVRKLIVTKFPPPIGTELTGYRET